MRGDGLLLADAVPAHIYLFPLALFLSVPATDTGPDDRGQAPWVAGAQAVPGPAAMRRGHRGEHLPSGAATFRADAASLST